MSKGRGNDMLGLGGQRRRLSETDMRGNGFGIGHGNDDPMAVRRELIRRLTAKKKAGGNR
jgi:hypothetical protein